MGTPGDLIKLAELAMRNPVFAEIVNEPEATLPVVIAEYTAPWGDQATIFVEQDINWVVYDGMTLHETTDLKPISPPLASGPNVGTVTVRVAEEKTSIPLKTTGGIFDPDVFWRLTRLGSSALF